jgi:hypothetical protein
MGVANGVARRGRPKSNGETLSDRITLRVTMRQREIFDNIPDAALRIRAFIDKLPEGGQMPVTFDHGEADLLLEEFRTRIEDEKKANGEQEHEFNLNWLEDRMGCTRKTARAVHEYLKAKA